MLTREQLLEWGEYFQLEPWGFELEDLLHARLMALVAGVAGADATYRDFLLVAPDDAEEAEPTPDQLDRLFGTAGTPPPRTSDNEPD